MGKKSKKKGGGAASKAARKEKLQERREQKLEQLDQNSNDGGGNNELVEKRPNRQYFVGDRVWFRGDFDPYFDEENPNTYRGIVQAVNGEDLVIKSLQTLIDGGEHTQTINSNAKPTDGKFVSPDFCDLTLRFDIGEKEYAIPMVIGTQQLLLPFGQFFTYRSMILPRL